MSEGWICIHRKMLKWEWYDEPNTAHLFLYCLLRANYEDTEWRGITIKRGSFVTSLAKLAQETGLTIQQVRTSINRLKSTNEITSVSTSQNRLITVKNYDLYQDNNNQFNKQLTNEQQTNNKRLTTDNNINNINKEKNIESTKELYNTHTIKEEKTKNVCVDFLSKEDKKILKAYAKKSNARNVSAYVNSLIVNGGYIEILKEEKQKQEKLKQLKKENPKESIPPPEISKEEDEKIKQIQKQVREKIRRLK